MKTYIKVISISILSTLTLAINAEAQVSKSYIAPWISKDVVRFSNKNELRTPSLVVKSIGHPAHVISKGVQKQTCRYKSSEALTNMISSGYPDWIISKAVNVGKK